MIVQICVGSSCHLKGSQDIIKLMQEAITSHNLDDDITLAGNFCAGRCNREGVTITIDDTVFCGITRENFKEFFEKNIVKVLNKGE